ncbi:MAG: DUF4743 domain-containing protein [Rhodospirillaceae bacterium]|mgnify:FL=1|nr:DUF4743 domain-containing protein [Rhodospirillaceae bacterium]MBT6137344.1 DUF4743 domain-containing protein [Rhodospirillaceae bacterium]
MGYMDHVHRLNRHEMLGFQPFFVAETKVGWVRKAFAEQLAEYPEVFHIDTGTVSLARSLSTFDDRSAALAAVVPKLRAAGLISGRDRDEPYPVAEIPGGEALAVVDRGAATEFGLVQTGFHLNGLVQTSDGPRMWVAKRAANKTTYPGALDNMVAGGQPHGLTIAQNVVKECAEEAGIPEALARTARPVGAISYVQEVDEGLRRHMMYLYDLDLPGDFTPFPADGEVQDFRLMEIEEVAEIVATSEAFKYNCNLAIIDFLIRHGHIGPDDPDYAALVIGLHAKLP